MRALVAAVAIFVAGMQAVYGEEAVLNNPPAAVSLAKSVVQTLSPSYETVWAWNDGTWSQGVSASLYNITSNEIHLASLRVGYATGETVYGGVGLDLPGLSKRFIPASIKGVATVAPLDVVWSVVGKYARIGLVIGNDWNERKLMYGMTVGAAVNF